ncbi:hypothetical protein FACS1894159_00400 [Bacteroidia bacterium]|nr:hypothetical protein FACS1894159_00400 [Bacteroidia bacterium]
MKKIILFCSAAAMILSTASLNAQPPKGARQHMTLEQRVQQMKEKLDLSDDQSSKLLKIYQDAQTASSKENITPEERRAIMKQSFDKTNEVLTPEQREKVQQARQQAAQGGAHKQHDGKGAPQGKGHKKGGNNTPTKTADE